MTLNWILSEDVLFVGRLACADPQADALHFFDLAISGVVSRALYGVGCLEGAARDEHARCAVDLFLDGRAKPRP